MTAVVVSLGGVPFRDMEIPEKIAFGGAQRLAVHSLIGGGRVVAALGLDDGIISFSGIFSGADAVERAQLLDAARASGASLPLAWDRFFYLVVIKLFSAEYMKSNWIPFRVECVVLTDPVALLTVAATSASAQVADDVASAAGLSGQAGISVTALGTATPAGLDALQNDLSSKIQSTGQAIATTVSVLNGTNDIWVGTSAVSNLVDNSSGLAALSQMQGYVSRASANSVGELS